MKRALLLLTFLCASLPAFAQFVNFADSGTPVSLQAFLQTNGLPTNYIATTNPASLAANASVDFQGSVNGLTVWLDIYDDGYASGMGLVNQAAFMFGNFTGADVTFPANTLRLGVDGLQALGGVQLTAAFTFTYVNDGANILVDSSAPSLNGVLFVSHYDASTGSFYFTNPNALTVHDSSIIVVDGKFNTSAPSGTVPVVTSAASASGTYGSSFSYGIAASDAPTSYSLLSGPLPAGLSLNPATGLISGTAGAVGSFNVMVGATNSAGTGTQALAITIAPKGLTVSGLAAGNKVYDGMTGTSIDGTGTLVGVVGGDVVVLVGTPTGEFVDADIGTGKNVSISGLSLSGTSAGNYSLAAPSATAAITAITLTVSGLSAGNKPYDGTATATISGTGVLAGIVGSDTVTLKGTATGAFTSAGVGKDKAVTISGLSLAGANAGNYALAAPAAKASITPRTLTLPGLGANSKVYDGTTAATLTGASTLAGIIAGDNVTLSGTATGAFADANAGAGKALVITGLSLGGSSAGNYVLSTLGATAAITAATLTPSVVASNKAYDGTTAASIASRLLTGVLAIDAGKVALSGGTAAFADAAVGAGKTVTVTGLSLSGPAAGNYQLSSTSATTTADITATPDAIALSNLDQTYDGAPKSVLVTTTPAGLSARVTYNNTTTAPTNAGSYAVSATITATGYSGSTTGTLVIARAVPTVVWAAPAAISAGTALSSAQLNATANVPGTFAYSPAAGTVLAEGAGQTLYCTFTPTDTTNYTILVLNRTITVGPLRIAPTITSPDHTTFTTGVACSFTVTAGGAPAPLFSATGLPTWATLDMTTGVISGTPPNTTGAPFAVVLTASNGTTPDATQNFTLKVEAPPVGASALTVSTLAGQAQTPGRIDGAGSVARFHSPLGVAADSVGNFYLADTINHLIRKVSFAGVVTTVAGQAGVAGSADGPAAAATFNAPAGLAIDVSGNLYVADTLNHTIRKISASGAVTTLAGQAGLAGSTDGSAVNARFYSPEGVAADGLGHLYVADTMNHTLRKIDLATGDVSTVAGRPRVAGGADGRGNVARFNSPSALALSSFGTIYVADSGNNAIRKIDSDGNVTTLAGLAGSTGAADGPGAEARFNNPTTLAIDGTGAALYVADTDNHTVRKVATVTGAVTTLAGSAGTLGSADGTGAAARFDFPSGMAWWNNGGSLGIADSGNHTVRQGTLAMPVSIVVQPQNQSARQGTSATFSVVASGLPAPTYQWYFNNTAIPGATAATYTRDNVSPGIGGFVGATGDTGNYTVVVSNVLGSVTSNAATLTIVDAHPAGGGGGAPSGWFYLALAAVCAARGWTTRTAAKKIRS